MKRLILLIPVVALVLVGFFLISELGTGSEDQPADGDSVVRTGDAHGTGARPPVREETGARQPIPPHLAEEARRLPRLAPWNEKKPLPPPLPGGRMSANERDHAIDLAGSDALVLRDVLKALSTIAFVRYRTPIDLDVRIQDDGDGVWREEPVPLDELVPRLELGGIVLHDMGHVFLVEGPHGDSDGGPDGGPGGARPPGDVDPPGEGGSR